VPSSKHGDVAKMSALQSSALQYRPRSEGALPADSVEKQRVSGAESSIQMRARVPFLSGFARLLR
jgi:hypothetical protein